MNVDHLIGPLIPYQVDFFVAHYRLSLFLSSFSSLSLGLFIFIKNARSIVNRMFTIFMVSVSIWSFTQALIGTYPDPTLWLSIARIEHFDHVFIPSVFLHFVHTLIGIKQRRRLLVSYAISFVCFCLVPTQLFIREINVESYAKFALEAGPIYPLYMVWFVGTIIEALIKLHRAIGAHLDQPIERLKLKYIFWATFVGYAGALPNFLYVYNIDLYPVNPFSTYFVPIYPAVIAYAIVRHQVLDIRVVIRRSLVYSILAAIITGVYFSFVLVTEKLLRDVMGYRSVIGSLIAGFVIALCFNPLKEFVQRFIDRLFFHGTQAVLAEENERLRQEVARSEKLKAVSTLAAGMAHEIKNPLASIKTFAQYLPEKYDDPAYREKFARIMSQEVDKMNLLVQRLLEFARPMQPRLQPVRVSTVVKETLDFLQGTLMNKQIQVDTTFADTDEVLADQAQLKQVFLNLLLNSAEAIEPPGRISIATAQDDGHLKVIVADTGRGIPQKDLQHVFDPFFTTKTGGTGLGLSVVHSIVREHDGRVDIESGIGQGTTVSITLPTNGRSHESTENLGRG